MSLILWILLGATPASAKWNLAVGSGSFQGSISVGGAYRISKRHTWEVTLGQYIQGRANRYQLNGGYHFTPWRLTVGGRVLEPLHLGVMVLYALDRTTYFEVSPPRYPEENYYEETAIRPALVMGTGLTMFEERVHFIYELALVDTGILAGFNNEWTETRYFFASGMKLRMEF